jgi:acid phosphatase family membrane protein YuiD
MRDYLYLITPLLAWFVAGAVKFLISSLKSCRLRFDLIGYGGMPSNHSTIVSSVVGLIAYRHGVGDPAFGVAIGLLFIVGLDANSLRTQVGKHATIINLLTKTVRLHQSFLRERMGHTQLEILFGVILGLLIGVLVGYIYS